MVEPEDTEVEPTPEPEWVYLVLEPEERRQIIVGLTREAERDYFDANLNVEVYGKLLESDPSSTSHEQYASFVQLRTAACMKLEVYAAELDKVPPPPEPEPEPETPSQ